MATQVGIPEIIFGAGAIGDTEKGFTYTWTTPETVSQLLDLLKSFDITHLDSAQAYPPGNQWHTEILLGQAKAADKGFTIDSKTHSGITKGPLSRELLPAPLDKTLDLLGTDKIGIFYIHAPTPNDGPPSEVAAAFDQEYRKGKFSKWGICSYTPTQLSTLLSACEAHNYLKPSIYQGQYSALYRNYETDLFPLLRKHNIPFYAYSPLAGGFLTGKVTAARDANATLTRSRWMGESAFAAYPNLYDQPVVHDALRKAIKGCEDHGVSITEASMRWLMHHSILKEHDGIIIGATKEEQIRSNVEQARSGPLPEEILEVMETLWRDVKDWIEGKGA